jgi:hypothetical protein
MMWSLAVLPWRSGHGRVRPWDIEDLMDDDKRRHGPLYRLKLQLTSLGSWGQYVRLLVAAR